MGDWKVTLLAERAYNAAYYAANREKIAAQQAAYYESNRDKKLAYQKAYSAANKEKIAAYKEAYGESHREGKRERDARQQRWFTDNLNILKAAQGCVDEGPHSGRLEHHHVDPDTKGCNISEMSARSLEAFLDELDKCTVLCDACHHKRHVELRQAGGGFA